jgi:hypothetical protein
MAQWSPGRRVVVLGAGATRGAEFVVRPPEGAAAPGCLPPLNADFFTQLQRVTSAKHDETIAAMVHDVVQLYGPNFSLTLEEYFTQLEAMLQTARGAAGLPRGYRDVDLSEMRLRLLDCLSAVLEESADVTKLDSLARSHPCGYHASLVRSLAGRDTIISFNYDCVMDNALRENGKSKWSAKYGYCFLRPSKVQHHDAWSAQSPPTALNKSINFLKLHGSLNWYPFPTDPTKPIRLRQRTYKQRGHQRYEIVPPEYVKRAGAKPEYETLWTDAALALRKAEVIAFVGFSFTPTDLDVEALFRLSLVSNKRLRRVIIANPNGDHRRRIRGILSPALQRDVGVVQFDSLADLSPHCQELLR